MGQEYNALQAKIEKNKYVSLQKRKKKAARNSQGIAFLSK